jgi:diguanylate cyclase (GGDEF)-like protein/PAS domain S-box-containing protein
LSVSLDLVLLSLLILFFGVQQRHRPEPFFKLWLAGWALVLTSTLIKARELPLPAHHALRDAIRQDALFCAGLCFVLSFILEGNRRRTTLLCAVMIAVPACLAIHLVVAGNPVPDALLFVLVAIQIFGLVAALILIPRRRVWLLTLLCSIATLASVGPIQLVSRGLVDGIPSGLIADVLFCAGILFFCLPMRNNLGRWIGGIGFAIWSAYYLMFALSGATDLPYPMWGVPKYFVGFGMILIFFAVAREAAEDLGQKYRSLYQDYRLLYETNPHPMWICNSSTGRFLSVNEAAVAQYGYSKQEFLAMTIFQIRPDEDAEALQEELTKPQNLEKQVWRHKRRDGTLLDVDVTGHDILFEGVKARFLLAIDITEREELYRQLHHRAHHDALTGLPNRVLLDDRITECLARSESDNTKAAVFTIDIDRFKQVNDTYGHPTGDECLKVVATRLRSRVRQIDTIARTGGEEFTIVVGGLSGHESAERVSAGFIDLFHAPIIVPGHEIKMAVSVGGALYPDDGTDAETLRKRSDQALYQAKRTGGSRAVFATADLCHSIDLATSIEMALREALRSNGLMLHYQPICDSAGDIRKVEALLRTMDQTLAALGPSTFISVAEESGLIIPLGKWVLEEACRQLVKWQALGIRPCPISVNISARQLIHKDFADEVLQMLEFFKIEPHMLELELTETTAMTELSAISETMGQLARAGLRFSIDDFGTGYSSLSRLNELPITSLKIDRAFVTHLAKDNSCHTIVLAVIQMAKSLSMQIVAEGVETEEQFKLLREAGCDFFQGYLFAQPLPAAAMTDSLPEIQHIVDFATAKKRLATR